MEYTSLDKWFDNISENPIVTGVLVIDKKTKLSIGNRGKGSSKDVIPILQAISIYLEGSDVGSIIYKTSRILIKIEEAIIIAIYTDANCNSRLA